jgi:hypothetical protein
MFRIDPSSWTTAKPRLVAAVMTAVRVACGCISAAPFCPVEGMIEGGY